MWGGGGGGYTLGSRVRYCHTLSTQEPPPPHTHTHTATIFYWGEGWRKLMNSHVFNQRIGREVRKKNPQIFHNVCVSYHNYIIHPPSTVVITDADEIFIILFQSWVGYFNPDAYFMSNDCTSCWGRNYWWDFCSRFCDLSRSEVSVTSLSNIGVEMWKF